jgi:glycerate kinase
MAHPVFLLVPDSFKESMTAQQACAAMERGITEALPDANCIKIPMADGGEGAMQTLLSALGGERFTAEVTGPLGEKVMASYAISGDGATGLLELASASGLELVPPAQRNPLITTTYGTGELIRILLARGVKKLIIGIGGSATNDGGAGIAQALGVQFFDADGNSIGFGGGELAKIDRMDTSGLITHVHQVEIEIACDVNNPLTGTNGASAVYGPQKGASAEMVEQLGKNLEHYARKIREFTGRDIEFVPSSGAAGGAGAGLMAFLNARLEKGIDLMMKYTRLEEKIKQADYIFTGEGSIDAQTMNGKTISGIVQLANKYHKPVIAFAGKVADSEALFDAGITAVFGIVPGVMPLEEALKSGAANLEQAARNVAKIIAIKNT